MKKKILVLGGSGNLGSILRFQKFFKSQLFPSSKKLNVIQKKTIMNYFDKYKFNLIVNCAAMARIAECEKNKKKAYKINVKGLENLVQVINEKDPQVKLVHISSDAVYACKNGNYSEKSKLKPYNYYGITKAQGEKIVKKINNYIIIRTRFFNKKKIKFSSAAVDSFSSSIEVNSLAKILIKLIKTDFNGVINIGDKKKSDYNLYKKFKKNIKMCKLIDIQRNLKFKISKDASMRTDKLKKYLSKNG